MDINIKILTLLAIICVIAAAGLVCAADNGGHAGSNYHNINGVSESQYNAHEVKVLEPGNGLPLENQTAPAHVNATGNAAGHVAVNATTNATSNATHVNATNTTGNTTHANATHANATHVNATHNMPVAGNPIVLLLAGVALVGGYTVLKRKD